MTRSTLLAVLASAGMLLAGCGTLVPMPVQPTPLPDIRLETPQERPPRDVAEVGYADTFCVHQDLPLVRFVRRFNAADGEHYHTWMSPLGERFSVRC
jgi:hypothetical protein